MVEQRHRDAAADMWEKLGGYVWHDFQLDWLRDGTADHGPLVQAFAHFEAALSRPAMDREAVRNAVEAELLRQESIGAGDFIRCPETGLFIVNMDIDPNGLASAILALLPGDAVEEPRT